jgi:hypothetical protein
MRNHIAGHGKADLCQLVRIRSYNGGRLCTVRRRKQSSSGDADSEQQNGRTSQLPMLPQAKH